MRLAPLAVLVAVTSPAFAEETCDVRVVRAPKHVRAAIEARVGIESECTPLEVRVVKKRRKYQVSAKSADGEVRAGEARDAGRVAELVMTWAAPAVEAAEPASEPVAEAPPPVVGEPEPLTLDSSATLAAVAAAPSRRETGRDVALGVVATTITYGLRGEADVLAWRGFSLGVALGVSDTVWSTGDAMTGASLDMRDVSGALVAAKTFGTGAWRLRVQGGVGLVYTRYRAKTRTAPVEKIADGDGTTRMIEGAVTVSRDLGSSWAASFGPLLTYFAQTFALDEARSPKRDFDVGGWISIRKRL